MSNSLTTNPIVVDIVSASALITSTFRVNMIRWVGGSTAGHTAVVQDGNGNLKWSSVATGSNYVEETHFTGDQRGNALIFAGLLVPTLGSGTLYLYVDSKVPSNG